MLGCCWIVAEYLADQSFGSSKGRGTILDELSCASMSEVDRLARLIDELELTAATESMAQSNFPDADEAPWPPHGTAALTPYEPLL